MRSVARLAQVALTAGSLIAIGSLITWHDRGELRDGGRVRVLADEGATLLISEIADSDGPARVVARSDLSKIEPGLARLLGRMHPGYVTGYFLCVLGIAVSLSARWRLCLGMQGEKTPALSDCAVGWCQSQVVAMLPTSQVGGDLFRIERGRRLVGHWPSAAWAVATERLLGLVALGVAAAFGLLGWRQWRARDILFLGILALLLTLLARALRHRVPSRDPSDVADAPQSLWSTRTTLSMTVARLNKALERHRRELAAAFTLSVTAQLFFPLSFVMVDRAIGLDTPAWCYLLTLPVIAIVKWLPIHVAGIGIVEGGLWISLTRLAARTDGEVIAIAAASRILALLWTAVLGIAFLIQLRAPSDRSHEARPAALPDMQRAEN